MSYFSKKDILDHYKRISPVLGYDLSKINQGDDQWFFAKLGVISSSNAYRAIGSKPVRETYRYELLGQIITRELPQVSAPSLSWGHDNEDGARALCELHLNIPEGEIEEFPILFLDETMRVATSPDGLNFRLRGGYEYKNPFNTVNHLKFILTDYVNHQYIAQCQHQMLVTGFDAWFYGSHDRRMTMKQLHMKAFERDDSMHDTMIDAYQELSYLLDKDLKKFGLEFGNQWHLNEYKQLQRG